MEKFDVLIIGGGVAGLSCALILGSAKVKPFAENRRIGIITHQINSSLKSAELNHVLGFKRGTKGADILKEGLTQLATVYPHIEQLENEKVTKIKKNSDGTLTIFTLKNKYITKTLVVAVGASNLFNIEGLMKYVIPHQNIPSIKEKIMLKNTNHLIEKNIYVAGVLAGIRSQFAIAAGSGTQVATDILTEWNNGNHTMIHDSIA